MGISKYLIHLLSVMAFAQESNPIWITKEKTAMLKKIGIDPNADVKIKGNYRWEYKSQVKLIVGIYSCPAGTMVDISRSIFLVKAEPGKPCANSKGTNHLMLKVLPNGAVEPM